MTSAEPNRPVYIEKDPKKAAKIYRLMLEGIPYSKAIERLKAIEREIKKKTKKKK